MIGDAFRDTGEGKLASMGPSLDGGSRRVFRKQLPPIKPSVEDGGVSLLLLLFAMQVKTNMACTEPHLAVGSHMMLI